MEQGLVSMEATALTQFSVSLKTTGQNASRIGSDPSKLSLGIIFFM